MAKEGANKVQSVAMGHNRGMLSKGIDRILKIDIEIQKKKADRMNVFNELDDQGFDRKEVAKIVKLKTKAEDLNFKRGVNQMCLELEMPEEYNLTPEQMAKLEDRDKAENGDNDAEVEEEDAA